MGPAWTSRLHNEEDLEELLARLPLEPGVYIMRDRKGSVVYVGKAAKLRQRVRQYFSGQDVRYFVPLLAGLLGDIETIVTANEKEALLLENNLIKEHQPRFNFKLRDDKQFLLLQLKKNVKWPRLELVRKVTDDNAAYFGPYHSAQKARQALRVVNRHFQLRTCSDYALTHRKRACLQYQIGRCPAPCVLEVDEQAYAAQVRELEHFLSGRQVELLDSIRGRMEHASESLEFETAARARDQLRALQTILESQRVVAASDRDQDVIGLFREGGQVEIVLMQIRRGMLMGTQTWSERGMELPDCELLHGFVLSYYEAATTVPDEVLLPAELTEEDVPALAAWLEDLCGHKVSLLVPQRGDRRKLVVLAGQNAASNFKTRRNEDQDATTVLTRLQERLKLSRLPQRIECFDISHIQGSDPVASMVVFVQGRPAKALYRSFKIKGTGSGADVDFTQNDDFRSMHEVLSRRFRRGLEAEDARWELPDLIVIDGGKGQLGMVVTVMQDLGITIGADGIDLVALAKERDFPIPTRSKAMLRALKNASASSVQDADVDAAAGAGAAKPAPGKALADHIVGAIAAADMGAGTAGGASPGDAPLSPTTPPSQRRPERVFLPHLKDPIVLPDGSSELFLMTRLRDEAHRFAITHHRKRRGKRALVSVLDDVEGVGPALRRTLISHFGTVRALKAATQEELLAVKGIGPRLAAQIHTRLGPPPEAQGAESEARSAVNADGDDRDGGDADDGDHADDGDVGADSDADQADRGVSR